MTADDLESSLIRIFADKGGVIGVCGLPGSGKSTLVARLSKAFPSRSLSINLDDFCIAPTPVRKWYLSAALEKEDRDALRALAQPEDSKLNPYADPLTWYDWQQASLTLRRLKEGKAVVRENAWDQTTGLCNKTVQYSPPSGKNPIYIVDCVYLFENVLRPEIDVHVEIDMTAEESFRREKARDSHRNSESYAAYKKMVTDIYCVPYLKKYRDKMDFIVS